MNCARGQLFIGVDGGGTGCRARLVNGEGRVLGTGIAGPAAVRIGLDKALAAVEHACRGALEEAGLPLDTLAEADAAIGLAGIGRKGVLEQVVARKQPFRSVIYVNDAVVACVGAHAGADGGIVIVGTGSVGFAVVAGREIRVGGYGFPISDEGSGADLGLNGIRLALRAQDGRAVETSFTHEVMARFGDDPFEAVAWMDRASATDYAAFAPLVVRHANDGDPLARAVIRDGAEKIDELVRRLVECGAPRVALLGGLASPIEAWLAPDVQRRLSPIRGDAIDGALHLARGAAARASGNDAKAILEVPIG